jgi:ribose/xylose/arabinose/galactoside ABC-type transport system permease subunit
MKNYYSEDSASEALGCFGLIILVAVLLIFAPFLNFACGWITGWLIKVTFGDTFIRGLSMLGLSLNKEALPLFCGTIGVIGSFFKSTTNIKKND